MYRFPKRKNSALVAINEWLASFNVHTDGHKISPGQKTVMTVQPMSVVATERFRALNIAKRGCRFPHETLGNGSMFKTYDQRSCRFECRLEYAAAEAGCVPWDMPDPNLGEWDICTSVGENNLGKFDDAMGSDAALDNCGCLPNCEGTDYGLKVLSAFNFIKLQLCYSICRFMCPISNRPSSAASTNGRMSNWP